MFYIPFYAENRQHFEVVGRDENGFEILTPKATATKEMIQSLFRSMVVRKNNKLGKLEHAYELCNEMIKLFKNSECYKEKSEKDRKEVIEYLSNHPEIIEVYEIVDADDNFI